MGLVWFFLGLVDIESFIDMMKDLEEYFKNYCDDFWL